jgi:enoyl-CoA hydratase/carnithine racemase
MSYENILTERLDRVALITLNRPEKLNPISYEMACELDEELTQIESDDALDVVILTGAGDRAFSAGGDIPQMAGMTSQDLAARQANRNRATWHLASYSKPIIGAINGLAYGGAAQLTTMLDIRIGCERTEFRFLAARYGRVNSTWSLPFIVGAAKAKELLYTGRPVGAEEAERIGLLNRVVPFTKLRDAALETAQMISKNDARMVQGIKRLLHEDVGLPLKEQYENEREARGTWLKSNHPREGFKEFLTRKGYQS